MENAIVVDDYRVLNSDGLRYDDEFVKHKIPMRLATCTWPVTPAGRLQRLKSGHALNNKLLRVLMEQPDAYEIVSFADESKAPRA